MFTAYFQIFLPACRMCIPKTSPLLRIRDKRKEHKRGHLPQAQYQGNSGMIHQPKYVFFEPKQTIRGTAKAMIFRKKNINHQTLRLLIAAQTYLENESGCEPWWNVHPPSLSSCLQLEINWLFDCECEAMGLQEKQLWCETWVCPLRMYVPQKLVGFPIPNDCPLVKARPQLWRRVS